MRSTTTCKEKSQWSNPLALLFSDGLALAFILEEVFVVMKQDAEERDEVVHGVVSFLSDDVFTEGEVVVEFAGHAFRGECDETGCAFGAPCVEQVDSAVLVDGIVSAVVEPAGFWFLHVGARVLLIDEHDALHRQGV